MVTSFLPTGSKTGVGYQADLLANELQRRGHEVTVLSPSPKPETSIYAHRCSQVNASWRTLRRPWRLRSSMDWSSFDVIHAHDDDVFLSGRSLPPRVRTMHGTCFQEALHVRGIHHRLRMAWLGILEVGSSVGADRTVAVSENTRSFYPWIRQVIPNGVDCSLFRAGMKSVQPIILFVGTYHHRKRGALLMDVFEREVRRRIEGVSLRMVCSDAPPMPAVSVLGRLSAIALAAEYRRATVFCLPSSYEGFGIPYIEAMASGTAIIATNNPGANEVLAGGKYGVLCDEGDLGGALIRLLEDEPRRQQLAWNGLERAAEFSIERVAAAYESVYAEVVGRRRSHLVTP